MLNSPHSQELQLLLDDSQIYFKEVRQFLEEQVALLMGPAVAVTKYLTAYLYKVALKNIEKSCAHLDSMRDNNHPKLAEKLVQYLSRTHDFFELRARNSHDSAKFILVSPKMINKEDNSTTPIPVPFHVEFAEIHVKHLQTCQVLLERAQKLAPQQQAIPKKWFSSFLLQANLLPNIWAAGWGLKFEDKESPSQRLEEIYEELIALDKKTVQDIRITKTTKAMLQIDGFTAEPNVESEYHEHIPPIQPVMNAFKEFMAHRNKEEALTMQNVHEAISTTYPKPSSAK